MPEDYIEVRLRKRNANIICCFCFDCRIKQNGIYTLLESTKYLIPLSGRYLSVERGTSLFNVVLESEITTGCASFSVFADLCVCVCSLIQYLYHEDMIHSKNIRREAEFV